MAVQMVFPNHAVADIKRSTAFYEALGFERNPVFSDECQGFATRCRRPGRRPA